MGLTLQNDHNLENCSIYDFNLLLKISRSSQGSPDWTCIVAGFTSGYMRIYLQVHGHASRHVSFY